MSRMARTVESVAALLSVFTMLSSTASAATWHNSGATTVHATAGAATFSSTSAGLICPAGGTTTAAVGATPAVPLGNWAAMTATVSWTNCTLGVSGYGVDCRYTFTASSWADGSPAVTNGVADLTCGVYLAGTKFCHIDGEVPEHYTNPNGATPGRLTLDTYDSLLVNSTVFGNCPLGDLDLSHLSEATFTLTSAAGSPIIRRTA